MFAGKRFWKKDYKPLCNISNKYVDEAKKESFFKI